MKSLPIMYRFFTRKYQIVVLLLLFICAGCQLPFPGPAPTIPAGPTLPVLPTQALPTMMSGRNYFVDLQGDDANAGTRREPFRTIQKAISIAQPGDTIIVQPGVYGPEYASGTYGHAEWNPTRTDKLGGTSGTHDLKITLKAQNLATDVAESDRTILTGTGLGIGIFINGASNIIIEGFEFTGFAEGISVASQSSKLVIRHNIFRTGSGTGLLCAPCSESVIEHNAFVDSRSPASALDEGQRSSGIIFYRWSENNSVLHNYFFGALYRSITWKRKSGPGHAAYNVIEGCLDVAIYLGESDDDNGQDMTSYGVTIEHNYFRDAVNSSTGVYYRCQNPIVVRNIMDAVVRYNYIENMLGSAIKVLPCEECTTIAGLEPKGVLIIGNTLANGRAADPSTGETGQSLAFEIAGRGTSDDMVQIYNNAVVNVRGGIEIRRTVKETPTWQTDAPPSLILKNNNLVNLTNGLIGDFSTTTLAYNNWYSEGELRMDREPDVTDVRVEPRFDGPIASTDPYSSPGPAPIYEIPMSIQNNGRLLGDSTLIDAGIDVGFPYQGSAPDIGSNEFLARDPSLDLIFVDVPPSHWAHQSISSVYQAGYFVGCNTLPAMFCPDRPLNRAESAVIIERGIHGVDFSPSKPSTPSFDDVPTDSWAFGWIEALYSDGFTAGCATDPLRFCPLQETTRAEGTVFFLRILHNAEYEPPEAQGIFVDVPVDWWGSGWVEEAYQVGIIDPCEKEPELRFCPHDPLSRALAADMLVRTKNLPTP